MEKVLSTRATAGLGSRPIIRIPIHSMVPGYGKLFGAPPYDARLGYWPCYCIECWATLELEADDSNIASSPVNFGVITKA